MVSTESELKDDVRQMTGYTNVATLSADALDTAYRSAKRHIRVSESIAPDVDWFDPEFPERQEALYWWTCLFAKLEGGELDSQDLQVGAVDQNGLLAKDDNSVTEWYRKAQKAMNAIKPDNTFQSASPTRTDREYSGGIDTGSGDLSDEI